MLVGPLLEGFDVTLTAVVMKAFLTLTGDELVNEPEHEAGQGSCKEAEPEEQVVVLVLPGDDDWRYAEQDDEPQRPPALHVLLPLQQVLLAVDVFIELLVADAEMAGMG